MTTIKEKIINTIKGDDSESIILIKVLKGISILYGSGISLRNRLYNNGLIPIHRLPCPVISIGNIVAGGTGKTPMTIFIAQHLKNKGLKPVILSRGYRGHDSEKGGMVSDGTEIFMESCQSGDEPFLMASLMKSADGIPVFIGKDRYKIGMEAFQRFRPDFMIIDDGFQHRKLYRDIDIVLLDSDKPFGNSHLLPRGILREPVTMLERADILILTRSHQSNKQNEKKRFFSNLDSYNPVKSIFELPFFVCSHKPVIRGLVKKNTNEIISDIQIDSIIKDIAVFSGISNNYDFRKGLSDFGFNIKLMFEYEDHHPYSQEDILNIISEACKMNIFLLVTTEKDYVRIFNNIKLPVDLIVVGVDIDFKNDETLFLDILYNIINDKISIPVSI